MISNVYVDMEIDSGAAVSVISEMDAAKVNAQIYPTSRQAAGYNGGSIDIIGETNLNVVYNNMSVFHKFLVVAGYKNNLFGRDMFSKFNVHVVVKPEQLFNVSYSVLDEFSSYLSDKFQSCVTESVHLEVDKNAKPIYAKARQIPIRLRSNLKCELDRLVKLGILTPVYSSAWATPIVTVYKPDGSLRLCADFSCTVNKYLQPVNSPLVTVDEVIASIGNAKVFSKLDLSQAFMQIPIHSSSKKYLVINTSEGLYQFNYLPFGLTASPGIFQSFISKVLANIPGVICYQDDILIMSDDENSHNSALQSVLTKLKKHWI